VQGKSALSTFPHKVSAALLRYALRFAGVRGRGAFNRDHAFSSARGVATRGTLCGLRRLLGLLLGGTDLLLCGTDRLLGLPGAGADLLGGLLTLVERTNQEDQRDDEQRSADEAKDPDRLSSLWAHRSLPPQPIRVASGSTAAYVVAAELAAVDEAVRLVPLKREAALALINAHLEVAKEVRAAQQDHWKPRAEQRAQVERLTLKNCIDPQARRAPVEAPAAEWHPIRLP